jgi:hypothetical protein
MSHNSVEADDIEILVLYETNNIIQLENCVKNALKSKQYRKRKEIYQVDIDTIKQVISNCDDIISKVANSKKTKTKLNIVGNKNIENLFMLFIEKKLDINDEKKASKIQSKKKSKKIKII